MLLYQFLHSHSRSIDQRPVEALHRQGLLENRS